MTYQIFVQGQPENGYAASVIGIPECVANGDTEEEAINKAKEALSQWLSRGRIFTVEVDIGDAAQVKNPWLEMYGCFEDDPTWDEFQANIQEYRRELDAEEAAREEAAQDEAA